MIQENYVEISYNIFITKLNNFIKVCSTKIKIINKFRKIKPWITAGIINSIRHRDNLKKLYIKNKSYGSKTEYTEYRDMLNKLIRHTKNEYYKNKIENTQHNYKRIWQTINEASNTQRKITEVNDLLDSSENVMTDNKLKADLFNKFFINTGENMAKDIKSNRTIATIHEPDINNSLYLRPVTEN